MALVLLLHEPRALSARILAETAEKHGLPAQTCADIPEAVEKALDAAKKDDVILAFGSLSYLGELAGYIQKRRQ